MADLDRLIEAIEAGHTGETVHFANLVFPNTTIRRHVLKSCDGSLDAANALHEELLPGWEWEITSTGYAMVWRAGNNGYSSGDYSNPARAWLLAILKAYRAMTADTGENGNG